MNLSPEQLTDLLESQELSSLDTYGGIDGILRDLGCDRNHGITDPSSISVRLAKYGSNELPDLAVRSFFDMLKEALSDSTLIILMICAVVSLVLELVLAPPEERATAWIDSAAILSAVAIVSLVQASSNHKQELQFAAVNRIKSIFNVGVIRNGLVTQLKNTDLSVGDVVLLEQGNKIPADGLCIECDDLRLNQSAANGESEAVLKGEGDPFLISNTYVCEGRGKMVVLAVGVRSSHGQIFGLIAAEESEDTPLQIKLGALAKKIGYMGVVAAALTFIALLVGLVVDQFEVGWTWHVVRDILNYRIVSISIIAVAVPEGLPLAVTISLAYSMQQMTLDNNFVRHLSACETMGSATVICTDKTGTLTRNEMNVERIIVGLTADAKPPTDKMLMRSISINSHAVVGDAGDIGSQTECALVRFVSSDACASYRNSAQVVRRFPFDRIRKRMSTVEQTPNGLVVHVKGAPDEMLENCTSYVDESGAICEVTEAFRTRITRLLENECVMAYRTLAVAYKLVQAEPETAEEAESDLTLLAILSIRDSLRKHTERSIASCQQAGIRVIMITGDHLLTATAIAQECNLLANEKIAITGAQLRKMLPSQLAEVMPTIAVVARSTPMDKHMLVTALKEAGHIVAVTGDGTNDVPALIAADVGLSMGKSGTELAKEASDIVVLDDDFRSIVRAVVWGRTVYNNIKRFLQFQLTANISTLFISFLSAVFLEHTPFKAVQLLWVNLIMDSLGALALATGKPHDVLLGQKPNSKETPLISSFMVRSITGQSLLQILLIWLILMFPWGLKPHSRRHYTLLYNVFVFCQMFNLINARAVDAGDDPTIGVFDTPLFFGIMIGVGVVEMILIQFAGRFFSCTPLGTREWLISVGLAGLTLPMGFLLRRFSVREGNRKLAPFREDNQRLLTP
jgi:Ca2+-transporting ATPase